MEDLDTPRVVPGSADRILRTLEAFGLEWDGEVLYQSRHVQRYLAVADELKSRGLTFACACSRRELAGTEEAGYPGTCRNGPRGSGPTATRFRVHEEQISVFEDRIQGTCRFELRALGDFVIRRKDGIVAYQLAVVVDDALQDITDVVRGADLLASTSWQIALQQALGARTPRYAHLPVVLSAEQDKLAKSRQAVPLDPAFATRTLCVALRLLNLPPPPELEHGRPAGLLAWAARSWSVDACRHMRSVRAVTPAA